MLDQKTIRRVFRDWGSLKALGENPLIDLQAVQARHQAAGYSPTPVGYGLALREVFQAALEQLRPESGPPNFQEKRWRPAIILTEQYLNGRSPEWVQEQLHVSKATYYGEQERALEMLAGALQKAEIEFAGRVESPVSDVSSVTRSRPEPPCLAPLPPAHPLVGRQEILRRLKDQLLGSPGQAVIALEGLPGVGKTAIAIELANDADIRAHFQDGILWAGLGRNSDLAAISGYWAAAVGVSSEAFASRTSLAERSALIQAAIGMRRMLLVIDDVWEIEAALALKVGGPNCAHLLTTRLVDLALDFTGRAATVIHELAEKDGLELLAHVAPNAVQVSPAEARHLVHLVGGLPLALILAGRYLQKESFNPQQRRLRRALDRLQAAEARLQVTQPQAFTHPHPGLPAGTPLSLQVVIGLSDAALDEAAHRALLDLSLFSPKPNTFSEEAALTVAHISPDVLDRLVDCGLLECAAPDRYTLHQTVADYAACAVYAPYVIYTAITKGASPEALGRMVAYFTAFAEGHENDFPAIELELTNLLAACEAAGRTGRHLAVVRLACALFTYLDVRGQYQICQQLLQGAQAAADALDDPASLAAVLYRMGSLEVKHGDSVTAWRHLNRGIGLARQAGARSCEADSLLQMGFVCLHLGNFLLGRTHFEQASALYARLGRAPERAYALSALGYACEELCDYPQARALLEQALAACRESGNRRGEGWTHYNLGLVAIPQGEFREACLHNERCRVIYDELGDRRGLGWLAYQEGRIFRQLGEPESARACFAQALEVFNEIGDGMGQGYATHNLGLLAYERRGGELRAGELRAGEQGQAEAQCDQLALDYYKRALAIFERSSCRAGISQCYHSLGALHARQADLTTARGYLEQALALRQKIGYLRGEAMTLACLGVLLDQLGEWETALDCVWRAVHMAERMDARPTHAYVLTCLAKVLASQESPDESESALEQAVTLWESMRYNCSNKGE